MTEVTETSKRETMDKVGDYCAYIPEIPKGVHKSEKHIKNGVLTAFFSKLGPGFLKIGPIALNLEIFHLKTY